MYTAQEIAEFIVFYSIEKNYTCSNLRLQKILYFIQAYFLLIRREPCFSDAIEAWDFGPVVPRVYRRYKWFGAGEIIEREPPKVQFESKDDRRIVEQVVDLLSRYSTTQLREMTQHQSPWLKNYHGLGWCQEIPLRDLKEFVNSRKNEKSESQHGNCRGYTEKAP